MHQNLLPSTSQGWEEAEAILICKIPVIGESTILTKKHLMNLEGKRNRKQTEHNNNNNNVSNINSINNNHNNKKQTKKKP